MLEEKSVRRYSQLRTELEVNRAVEESRIKAVDPAYSETNPLSELTKSLIDEINGKFKGDYGRDIYGKKINALQRQDVARAMIIAEQRYGILDQISANLTEKVLWHFSLDSRRDAPFLSISTRAGLFSWQQLIRDPLKEYFVGGRGRWSDLSSPNPVTRSDAKLELLLADGSGPVKLKLSVLPEDLGARWSLRGSSIYRSENRELLSKLNAILEDYTKRLDWMERYQTGWTVLPLDEKQIEEIRNELSIYYDLKPSTLDPLRQQRLLRGTDDFIETSRTDYPVRVYSIRCSECGRIAKFDIKEQLGSKAPKDWNGDSRLLRTPRPATDVCNDILSRAHRASSCTKQRMDGINPRTGLTESL